MNVLIKAGDMRDSLTPKITEFHEIFLHEIPPNFAEFWAVSYSTRKKKLYTEFRVGFGENP